MPAVMFDVWHTLLYLSPADEERYYRTQVALATQVLREAERRLDGAYLSDEELGRAFEQALMDAVAEAGRGRTVTPAQQILRAGVVAGRSPRPELYTSRLEAAVADQPFKPAPGALELLKQLHDEGYRVGVVGNTVGEPGIAIRRVLATMGFEPHVDTFVFSDEQPWAKPAPEIFWEALQRLGETRTQSVYVGDAWFDIEGARRAALRGAILFTGLQDYGEHYATLHSRSGQEHPRADYVVSSLREIHDLVHRLLPLP